jgi:hypothetical protein
MMRRFFALSRTAAFCLGLVACFSTLACTKAPVARTDLVPVSGKVTFQGKPLADAKIVFVPTGKDDPDRPAAVTDAEGAYELVCDDQAGAPPGNYQVVIMAFGPSTDDEVRPASLIPEKYTNPKKSGLTAVVKDQDENVIDFTLTP